jgi:hypothetical protein
MLFEGEEAVRNRMKGVLVNPTWEQMIEQEPLIAFSWYLSGRKEVLLTIADEIIEHLDQAFSPPVLCGRLPVLDHGRIDRAESLMWLWTLGAYEIVRTMCQAETCFSGRVMPDLKRLKKTLSRVRVPNAKMERPGQKLPVTSNRSPSGWDVASRDLLVGDPESGPISARNLLKEFYRVMSSITKDDILFHHEEAYEENTNLRSCRCQGRQPMSATDDGTDWERVRGMTEEEIEAGAASDPDNPPWTENDFRRARRTCRLGRKAGDLGARRRGRAAVGP